MAEVQAAQQIGSSQYVFAILFIILLFAVGAATKKYLAELKTESTKRESMLLEENAEREQELRHFYMEHKQESREREQKLMDHLEKSNDNHRRTSETLDKIQLSINQLEKKFEKMERN